MDYKNKYLKYKKKYIQYKLQRGGNEDFIKDYNESKEYASMEIGLSENVSDGIDEWKTKPIEQLHIDDLTKEYEIIKFIGKGSYGKVYLSKKKDVFEAYTDFFKIIDYPTRTWKKK